MIDLGHPATATGDVTTATVMWQSTVACPSAFKIKILHPNGGSYSVAGERGPFDANTTGYITVPLTPAIHVQEGDLIAVTQPKTYSGCGTVLWSQGDSAQSVMSLNGEGSGTFNGLLSRRTVLGARASASPSVLDGVLAAAGSVAGANGSSFKTALQLINGGVAPISGKLLFHPAGKQASASDPSINYSIAGGQAQSFPDVAAQMGASGLGSLDVVSNNSGTPVVTARIFNDTPNGTSGFTEELVAPHSALRTGESAVFAMPSDLTAFRMNIGVRTLDQGATITVYPLLANGLSQGSVEHTYAPNYFEQNTLAGFIAPATAIPNALFTVYVSAGNAIIYASTTDNKTNDSSVQFGVQPQP